MTLLCAFQVLLHRYTRSDDIVVGSPFANRSDSQTQSVVGLFVNTVALRTKCNGNPTFSALLNKVAETTLDGFENQECPLQLITQTLGISSRLNANPIFQTMFVLNNSWKEEIHFHALESSTLHLDPGTSMMDLTLIAEENKGGLVLDWEFATQLFSHAFIEQLATHYSRLLEQISANPELNIDAIPLLSPSENHRCVIEWNETTTSYAPVASIQQLFEEQAARTPDRIAVASGDKQITYRELNGRANQLARYLRKQHVQHSDLIALFHEKSSTSLISILGILKSGAAYLPIDPNLPDQRLQFMLADAGVRFVITHSKLVERLAGFEGQIVVMDRDAEAISIESSSNPDESLETGAPAYSIYTSGSTGAPKGVLIGHQSLLNFVNWARDYFALTEHDRVLQFASLSFDTAAEEIYPILTTGGTLVLPSEDMLDSVEKFVQFCVRERISVLDLPTAFWHQLVTSLDNLILPKSLRLVIIGGDQARADRVGGWHEFLAGSSRTDIQAPEYVWSNRDDDRRDCLRAYPGYWGANRTTDCKYPRLCSRFESFSRACRRNR